MKKQTKKCVVCGMEFEPKQRRMRCCSAECSEEHHKRSCREYGRRKKEIVKVTKTCPVCFKEFKTGGNRVCCSPICTEINRNHTVNTDCRVQMMRKSAEDDRRKKEFLSKRDADYAAWQIANGVKPARRRIGSATIEVRGQACIASTCGCGKSFLEHLCGIN